VAGKCRYRLKVKTRVLKLLKMCVLQKARNDEEKGRRCFVVRPVRIIIGDLEGRTLHSCTKPLDRIFNALFRLVGFVIRVDRKVAMNYRSRCRLRRFNATSLWVLAKVLGR